jgi:ketosteroid isomerase-like protein
MLEEIAQDKASPARSNDAECVGGSMCRRGDHASWQTFRMSLEMDCRPRYAACLGQNCIVEDADSTSGRGRDSEHGIRAMRDPAYAAFSALDPFFDIVRQGLAGLVDGDHYFDTIAPDAVFEFRYRFPGYPTKVVGREALMALYAGYGEGMALHGADALVVNISQTPGVVILEYEVQGNAVGSGKLYENRFISVVTIEDRKIVGWRDYMDSLAAMSSLT